MDILNEKKISYRVFTQKLISFINNLDRNDTYEEIDELNKLLEDVEFNINDTTNIFKSYNSLKSKEENV